MPHRLERRSLIGLLESVRPRNARHQNHRKDDNVFLAEREEVARPCQCAFQQTPVSQMVGFAGRLGFEPIVLDDDLNRQPAWLIRQGRPESWGT